MVRLWHGLFLGVDDNPSSVAYTLNNNNNNNNNIIIIIIIINTRGD